MRKIRLLAFAAPLALLLPLSAQADNWPAGAKKDYMKDCVAAASQSVDAKTAQQHCACGADKLSEKFTSAEITQLISTLAEVTPSMFSMAVCRICAQPPLNRPAA